MENINFLQTKEFFSLNSLTCLRNEYLFNDCQLCFGQCEHQALGLFKNKIHLFEEKCTSCGACIGSCPTESLNLSTFDINNFILSFANKDENIVVEKIDVPHFGMLNVHHLISLSLRSKRTLFLEYHENNSNQSLDYIEEQIQQCNLFLSTIGFEYSIFLRQHQRKIETSRRNLFKTIAVAQNELLQETNTRKVLTQSQKSLPSKIVLFKNSLKLVCEDISNTYISTNNLPVYTYKIDFQNCTNCVDCVTFCPTNALFQNDSKERIFFQSGKCIGCAICQQVCKYNAIDTDNHLDLITYMFDKTEQLVEFTYHKCTQCNNAFIKKDNDDVCEVCKEFTANHSQMFTLAKDL